MSLFSRVNRSKTSGLLGIVDPAGRDNLPAMPGTVPEGTVHRANVALSELKPGQSGIVRSVNGSARGRLRLLEMGLTPGTHVKVVRAAAFGGPLDVQVRGYKLSLRREEAASVWLADA
jgi:Fe2+ transport system protein FeoA